MSYTPGDVYKHVIALLNLIHREYIAAERISAAKQGLSLDTDSEGLALRRYLAASAKRPIPSWSLDVLVDTQLLRDLHAELVDAIAKLGPAIKELIPAVVAKYSGVSIPRKYPLYGSCFLHSAWLAIQQWAMLADPSKSHLLRHDTLPKVDLGEMVDGLTAELGRASGITIKGDKPCDLLGEAWDDLTYTEQELLNTMYDMHVKEPHGFYVSAVFPHMMWDERRSGRSCFDKTCSSIRKKLKSRNIAVPWKLNGRGKIHWIGKKQ